MMVHVSMLVIYVMILILPTFKDYIDDNCFCGGIKTTNYINESGLDKDYILQYSMSKGEWLSAVVPNIKGGSDWEPFYYKGFVVQTTFYH